MSAEQQCTGFPEGNSCPVWVTIGTIYCSGCRLERQRAITFGVPVGTPVPIGIVLEDLEAPQLNCKCSGDPTAPRHVQSLLHMEWAFRMAGIR